MDWTLPTLVLVVCALASLPLGALLHWALDDTATSGVRARLDHVLRRLVGDAALEPRGWRGYAAALLAFNALLFVVLFVVLGAQGDLPLNPDGKPGLSADLAFNTAVSFTTNTNLQHYSGEQSLSYFSQLVAVLWPQFVSAATGIAVLAALGRCLAGRTSCGSFARDLVRILVFVLLPLAFVFALALVATGVPMTFDGAALVTTLEGAQQTIARGPVAAVVAIKQLGTNGGGYFGANSTHPLENPTLVSNLLSSCAILALPMACVWWFGRAVGSLRHATVLFATSALIVVTLVVFAVANESAPSPALDGLAVANAPNLEGKELRFAGSAAPFWAVATTVTSNGSVNAMHDSLNPLTGLAPLAGMWLNASFGGVGVGVVGLFVFVITAVFVAGTLVGKSPEYLGKRVEAKEMKLAVLTLLLHPLCILGGTALFVATGIAAATAQEGGAHGLSEIVYEFSSAAANNGSGFEGLGDDTPAWNIATGVVMLLCRFLPIVLPLAIAGSLAAKRRVAVSAGSFRTDTLLFAVVLAAVIVIVGALLFVPVAVLGPIAEHLTVHTSEVAR